MAVDRERIYHKRDRLRQLRAFCRVVQTRSFTRAAELLDVTPSAVSIQVRQLEYELQANLLNREGSELSLTKAGERMYDLSEPLVRGMESISARFIEQLGDDSSLRVDIGIDQAIGASFMPAFLQPLYAQYPDVRVRIRTCLMDEGVEQLANDEVDLVVGRVDWSIEDRHDVVYHLVADYEVVVITARDHSLAERETVSIDELSAFPAIAPIREPFGQLPHAWAHERHRNEACVAVGVVAGQWDIVKRCVEHGLGVALVPSHCLAENDPLSTTTISDGFPTRRVGIITRRGGHLTSVAKRLIQLMAPDFST